MNISREKKLEKSIAWIIEAELMKSSDYDDGWKDHAKNAARKIIELINK